MQFRRAGLSIITVVVWLRLGLAAAHADSVTVQPGDTLWSIASKHHITVNALKAANPWLHGDRLQIGQHLQLPATSISVHTSGRPNHNALQHYVVRKGDTLWSIANKFGMTVSDIERLNPHIHGTLLKPGMILIVKGSPKGNTPTSQAPGKHNAASNTASSLSSRASGFGPPSGATVDEQNLYWMARIIHAEAHDEPMKAQIAVGDVVWHRMLANPGSTVHDIVFAQSGGHYQFSPAATGQIYESPSPDNIEAAATVLEKHVDVVPGAYYFYGDSNTPADDWIRKRPVIAHFDSFIFAK